MGKTVIEQTEYSYGSAARISRAQFRGACEAGLANVMRVGLDASSIRDRVEDLIRNARQVDANAWQCKDSCGCPMVSAGVAEVIITDNPSNRGAAGSIAKKFASGYDAAIQGMIGGGAKILTITD